MVSLQQNSSLQPVDDSYLRVVDVGRCSASFGFLSTMSVHPSLPPPDGSKRVAEAPEARYITHKQSRPLHSPLENDNICDVPSPAGFPL